MLACWIWLRQQSVDSSANEAGLMQLNEQQPYLIAYKVKLPHMIN